MDCLDSAARRVSTVHTARSSPPTEPLTRTFALERTRTSAQSVCRSSATNRLIHSKDKASVQLNIGHVNGALHRAQTVDACSGYQSALTQARRERAWRRRSRTKWFSSPPLPTPRAPFHFLVGCSKLLSSDLLAPLCVQVMECILASGPPWPCAGSSARRERRMARLTVCGPSAMRMPSVQAMRYEPLE